MAEYGYCILTPGWTPPPTTTLSTTLNNAPPSSTGNHSIPSPSKGLSKASKSVLAYPCRPAWDLHFFRSRRLRDVDAPISAFAEPVEQEQCTKPELDANATASTRMQPDTRPLTQSDIANLCEVPSNAITSRTPIFRIARKSAPNLAQPPAKLSDNDALHTNHHTWGDDVMHQHVTDEILVMENEVNKVKAWCERLLRLQEHSEWKTDLSKRSPKESHN
jgi:hypothetical protein